MYKYYVAPIGVHNSELYRVTTARPALTLKVQAYYSTKPYKLQ